MILSALLSVSLSLCDKIVHIEPELKTPFDAFAKARNIDAPKTLAVPTVFLVHRDGRFVHSRVYSHDMSGFEDIEYVDEKGRVLFHITDTSSDPHPPSASRIREEALVRAFLLESGYEAVVGITLGKLTHVRLGGRGEQLTLTFRVDGVEWKATSPRVADRDLRRGKLVGNRERFAGCTPGGLLASTVAGTSVVLLIDEPSLWFDAEGGGYPMCARRPGTIAVTLDATPRVTSDDGPWKLDRVPL